MATGGGVNGVSLRKLYLNFNRAPRHCHVSYFKSRHAGFMLFSRTQTVNHVGTRRQGIDIMSGELPLSSLHSIICALFFNSSWCCWVYHLLSPQPALINVVHEIRVSEPYPHWTKARLDSNMVLMRFGLVQQNRGDLFLIWSRLNILNILHRYFCT